MRKNRCNLLFYLLVWPVYLFAQESREVTIRFELDQIDNVLVTTSTLRFNKDFAFSFTFDDGVDDTFTLASKFLNGGFSAVDNTTYPGLFYTDGCGNRIPFTAGVSWYTVNSYGVDLHRENGGSGYMSYNQSNELYDQGWDFFNHSFDHDANHPDIDYLWQWTQNSQAYQLNTGHEFRYFVPPSGDTNYIKSAFDFGALAVMTSNQNYSGSATGTRVDNPMVSNRAVFSRHFISSGGNTLAELKDRFDTWTKEINTNNHLWWNEFTHRVRYDPYGGSMLFPDFRDYFLYMANRHGADGSDNGWFASAAQVYDYLLTRDLVKISYTKSGNSLQINIDYSKVPWNLRYYDLSLLLDTEHVIFGAEVLSGNANLSFSTVEGGYLINVNIAQGLFASLDTNPLSESSASLGVFPNPTNGPINIISYGFKPGKYKYQLINCSTGQEIWNETCDFGNDIPIDLSKLQVTTGVYLLVETDQTGQKKRFAKIMYHPDYH